MVVISEVIMYNEMGEYGQHVEFVLLSIRVNIRVSVSMSISSIGIGVEKRGDLGGDRLEGVESELRIEAVIVGLEDEQGEVEQSVGRE